MLIDTAQLRLHLRDPEWIVFDCRHDLMDPNKGAEAFAAGHIPGAYFAAVDSALSGVKTGTNGRHPLPDVEEFAAFLARHGVTATTQIVAYDDVGGQYSARLWWLARWIGLTQTAVLDGGFPKWVAEGHPVTTEASATRAEGTILPRPKAQHISSANAILAATEVGDHLVLDARAPERFRGEVEPIDRVAGHIPGARNRFFKTNLNPDLTLRPRAELKREFEELMENRESGKVGRRKTGEAKWRNYRPADVIHQCGSGITACANILAMEYAGLPGSKLYPGSWSEWVADPSRPVARG